MLEIVKKKKPNPQGKGQVTLLNDLDGVKGVSKDKSFDEITLDLFKSLFVLSSDFKFRAVRDHTYYLYNVADRYKLMHVAPDEWPRGAPGVFCAECKLRSDYTWSIDFSEEAAMDPQFCEQLADHIEQFKDTMNTAADFESVLPFHESSLGYHQRVLGYALSKSIQGSLGVKGLIGTLQPRPLELDIESVMA